MGVTVDLPLAADRPHFQEMLHACGNVFSLQEIAVGSHMIDEAMRGEYTILAANLDGETAGYCLAGPTPLTASTWHLYWLCVHPRRQRCGVASALQSALEETIRKAGGQRIVVETAGRADYDPARRFYRAAGYSQAGRIEDYYSSGDACVFFCKVLL